MCELYTDLQWLPAPPKDFTARILTLDNSREQLGNSIHELAKHSLNIDQLIRLGSVIVKLQAEKKRLRPLIPFRIAILSNATVGLVVPALIASAARYGIALEVIQSCYDQVAQHVLAPDAGVSSGNADAVLFALDYHALALDLRLNDKKFTAAAIRGVLRYLYLMRSSIKRNENVICIFQTFPIPSESLFGSLDRTIPGTLRNSLTKINSELAMSCASWRDVLFDVAALAETVGLSNWHDPRLWNLGRLPFSNKLVPLYADHGARIVAAICGKSRRALILDLDDTVWGGVLGDDGLKGIRVARGDAIGEAHLAVQHMALELRKRGVLLAVASKNADKIARLPFRKHPEMLLKLHDIASFQANWNDKATNIKLIAKELSIGLDTIVFLDDNPMERDLVRSLLPEVAVPELPKDPAYYARTLAAAGYFESITFTAEDGKRGQFYQNNAKRTKARSQAVSIDAYLASLHMIVSFQPFDDVNHERIVQLINKCNQYNLTTRRYTPAEVNALEADRHVLTLQVRLSDIFGDNGMVSVVICRPVPDNTGPDHAWELDTWLMSCRVLGRKIEYVVLQELLEHARAAGVRKLYGVYIPTARNKLVEDHYARLGFVKIKEEPFGKTRWELTIDEWHSESVPIKRLRRGFARSI